LCDTANGFCIDFVALYPMSSSPLFSRSIFAMTILSNYLLVLCMARSSYAEASGDQINVQGELANKEKPHFVHISLDPFTGEGTFPVPIDSDSFIDPGATVVLLERDLTGTATYYYGDSKDTKEASIAAQITGSCTVVGQDVIGPQENVYTSHCTVCVSYLDECAASASRRELWGRKSKCSHSARASITATGDILSRYLIDGVTPPLGVSLVDSEARLVITGGTHDLRSANSGIFEMKNDGRWNMVMKVPLNAEAACKLQEYA